MTFLSQQTYAERLARVNSGYATISTTSDATQTYLNEGVREFCKLVNGIPKEDYISVAPRFDSRTNWRVRVTITAGTNALAATDVAVTSTDRTDTTGTIIASDFQATLRTAIGGGANATVTFSTTTWKFTIDSIDGTDITIASPSGITYVDATDILFGKTGSDGAATWVSEIPPDATVEADLPTDFLDIEWVEWGRSRLYSAPYDLFISPQSGGEPNYYTIKNKKIRVQPYPTSQDLFHIRYRALMTDKGTDGTDNAAECSLPTETHMAPVYFAASKLLEETHEFDKAQRYYVNFQRLALNYRMREANQAPQMFPGSTSYQPPKVDL